MASFMGSAAQRMMQRRQQQQAGIAQALTREQDRGVKATGDLAHTSYSGQYGTNGKRLSDYRQAENQWQDAHAAEAGQANRMERGFEGSMRGLGGIGDELANWDARHTAAVDPNADVSDLRNFDPSYSKRAWDMLTAGGDGGAVNFTPREDYDASAAMKEYASGAWDQSKIAMDKGIEQLGGRAVGQGRLNTGFYDLDQGDLVRGITRDYSNNIATKALDAAGLTLQSRIANDQMRLDAAKGTAAGRSNYQSLLMDGALGIDKLGFDRVSTIADALQKNKSREYEGAMFRDEQGLRGRENAAEVYGRQAGMYGDRAEAARGRYYTGTQDFRDNRLSQENFNVQRKDAKTQGWMNLGGQVLGMGVSAASQGGWFNRGGTPKKEG